MPFDITIKGIGEKALGDFLAKIGTDRYTIKLSYKPHENQVKHGTRNVEQLTPPAKRSRVDADTVIMLNGDLPGEGTIGFEICKRFQKLEARHGIGNVTRGVLQDAVIARDDLDNIQKRRDQRIAAQQG